MCYKQHNIANSNAKLFAVLRRRGSGRLVPAGTSKQGWIGKKNAWLQSFLLGKKDINDDAQWQAFKEALEAQHSSQIIAAYNAAYARYPESR